MNINFDKNATYIENKIRYNLCHFRNGVDSINYPPLGSVFKKMFTGLLLMAVVWFAPFGIPGAKHLSTKQFLETMEFCESNIFLRLVYWVFWGQLTLTMYVAIWLLAEGVVILAGLGQYTTDFTIGV